MNSSVLLGAQKSLPYYNQRNLSKVTWERREEILGTITTSKLGPTTSIMTSTNGNMMGFTGGGQSLQTGMCSIKAYNQQSKRQPMEWERIFANPTSDKRLISSMKNQLNNKKQTTQL